MSLDGESNDDLARRAQEPMAAPDNALRQHITPLISIERQVGAHVIHALQQEHTVAVLTTVVPGPDGSQCIVSVGLNADHMEDVQQLLADSQQIEPRVPCVGFHCFVQPPGEPPHAS